MPKTVIYLSSCGIHPDGKPDPFMMQELPWLTRHFGRVVMVSFAGVATLDEKGVDFPLARVGLAAPHSWLAAPFSKDFWKEVAHLFREHKMTPVALAKLFLFTRRGLKMHYWTERVLRGCTEGQTVLYSCWMSFDGYAAALSKRKHPKTRCVVRGHAFDIDIERNPMNPYLMKRMIADVADGLYFISRVAKDQFQEYMRGTVKPSKVRVLAMGSGGEPISGCKRAPRFAQGILRVVSCAQLIPIKQVPILVEALSRWEGGALHWTHIGGGPGMEELRRMVEEKLDSKQNIIYELMGTVDNADVNRMYEKRSYDVFINTSQKEGVPVSMMEAMRYGIPVIAPKVGGIPELVHQDAGYLYLPEEGSDGVLKRLNMLADLSESETDKMRQAAMKHWNRDCCSSALLPKLFPEVAEKGA
ncbi:MAG: glycosyltransferase [Eubacteriales bacterium]|nr:glycosyltransferase [Eubacteriales bacterium]